MLPPFSYVRPDSLPDAVSFLDREGARVHAGGTDLLGCLREDVFSASRIVSIAGLSELRGVRATPSGGAVVGALTTITEAAEDPLLRSRYRVLAEAASEVASPQLRNQGTVGGNLCQKPRCWYYRGDFFCLRKGGDLCYAASGENQFHCIFGAEGVCFIVHPSDTAPALVALGAAVRIIGPRGERTVPVEDFHVPPGVDVRRETVLENGEIVTAVELPAPPPGLRSRYRKVRARRAWDFAIAGVALALHMDGRTVRDGRVVLSGAAPVPWRSRPVEQALKGKTLDAPAIEAAADAAVQGAKPLRKNGYKVPLFRAVVREELQKVAEEA